MATPPVLVLELNELCPPLIERFVDAGDLPNFAALRSRSACWVTDAQEPQEHLNPWIQWITAHTGVGYDDHGIFKLGEGGQLTSPTVADVASAAGRDVWLCGPMNVVPTGKVRGSWLPDPWNPHDEPQPASLEPFARFVRANVQEHTNAAHRSTAGDQASFLWFMARHGLSPATVKATLAQLARRRPGWQKAALLDRFQWDLFAHLWRDERPAFATFFSNTTAHYQHLYWRHMDPGAFEVRPSDAELERYGDAVAFGYREMDRVIGQAVELAGEDTTLVFCTAISQQPYLLGEASGGRRFHRPHDVQRFTEAIGLAGVTKVVPVMAQQFHIFFASEAEAVTGEERLAGLLVDGGPLMSARRNGDDVLTGCDRFDEIDDSAIVTTGDGSVSLHFGELFYRNDVSKSGYHHPHGMFWVRGAGVEPAQHEEPVPLRAVAPSLVSLLGLDPPATMATPPLLGFAGRGSVAEHP